MDQDGVMKRAFVIGIVGAESSGKTQLAQALRTRLAAEGLPAALIGETLREFCEQQRRTPRMAEQAAIAAEQTRRIAAAALGHAAVVADTTALMTAVYSELVFGDASLYAMAEQAHRRCDLTLLTALDLP
jgi:nicotinamide riboside kinase